MGMLVQTRRRGATLVGVMVVGLALTPAAARAADFVVTSTADAVDANPGDGACAAANGRCTLRAAVQEADAASGASTVTIPAGRYRLAIPPTPAAGSGADAGPSHGDPDPSGAVDIRGAGARLTIPHGGGRDPRLAAPRTARA